MIDTEKLRKAVKNFEFDSRPSSANDATPCTVRDLNTIIKQIVKLSNAFIREIEAGQSE